MSLILNIETSIAACSVALSRDQNIIDYMESPDEKSHTVKIIPYIEKIFKRSGLSPNDLDSVAVSRGPGSYTGLRTGASVAKGLAYSLKKPLIAVDTLLCMAKGLLSEKPHLQYDKNILLCPVIDARRMELYLAFYDNNLKNITEVKAEILNNDSFKDVLENRKIVFFGNGVEKCKRLVQHQNAVFIEDFKPLARYLVMISHEYFNAGYFANIAYFEPLYLKDFIATRPKKIL